MKTYAVKIVRNMGTGELTVRPFLQKRGNYTAYRLKYPREGVAEACRVFPNKKDAEEAYREEMMASENSRKTPEELKENVAFILRGVEELGLSLPAFASLSGIDLDRMNNLKFGKVSPSPRMVAKLNVLLGKLHLFQRAAGCVLPDSADCGNPCMGRGGNPRIAEFREAAKSDMIRVPFPF